ncbi:hypothetical protein POPTR_010G146301v4 [Populus trichocarpa]|uniref:Uncharacterized protein n=1 Tax=Populus trichocarpa TaxID=3694 RepID=A0A3N7FPD7_POPTR|nr:hypothetical protein POPTR_010G146301v4 [Populus trichocarpa]
MLIFILYGFENANYACCHLIGPHGGLLPCGNMSLVCPERTNKTSDAWRLKLQITDEYSTNSEFLNCSHK